MTAVSISPAPTHSKAYDSTNTTLKLSFHFNRKLRCRIAVRQTPQVSCMGSKGMSPAGKGGDGASHSQKQEPLIYAPDGRLPQPTKLGLVVQDAVRRWYLEAENDMNRGDVKAQALVGQMLIEGYGCDPDPSAGLALAEKARRRGYRMQVDSELRRQDAVLQFVDSSQAERLVLYHNDAEIAHRIFPNGGAEEFIQLPKYIMGGRHSFDFVLLRCLCLAPLGFKSWLDSSFLKHVITRVFFLREQVATSKEDLLQQLIDAGPPSGPIRVMCFPRTVELWLAVELEKHNFQLHPVVYTWTLHVFCESESKIRFQLRPAGETFITPSDGPKRTPGQFCKAAGKLTEALEVTGSIHGTGSAIDIGAAPGGWTVQLAKHFKLAIAVDPADMHPSALALSNVVHVQCMSQDAKAEVMATLGGISADLLCCDANRHPLSVVDMLNPMIGLLRPGGLLILTLKFRGKGRNKTETIDILIDSLKVYFEELKCLWLMANTQNERTLVARRKH